MKNLKIYSHNQLSEFENDRVGAVVWSKHVQFIDRDKPFDEELKNCDAKYVIFGIIEDMGVRANFGKPGAENAWKATLGALLNVQANNYSNASEVLLLGYLDFTDIDPTNGGDKDVKPADFHHLVMEVDSQVSTLVEKIVKAGKIPIGIGGGHNNAYGMLKGTSLALGKSINALNLDAHADLRPCDYRHSGNGFSYAYEEGFLKRYFIFGLHENYITQAISEKIEGWSKNVHFVTYDEMCIRDGRNIMEEAVKALDFVSESGAPFGMEIDCDVIENIPTSALTPSGFSVETARKLNHFFSRSENVAYLHICEAAPKANNADEMVKVGKLISYLITDFIR